MAISRFHTGWRRLIPFAGSHHVLMALLIFSMVLLSIMIAGCTTSGNLQNVYILSLSYVATTDISTSPSPLQLNPNITTAFSQFVSTHRPMKVRVSYFGMCISQESSQWMCAGNAGTLSSMIKLYGNSKSGEQDPLNLIWIAGKFKDEMLFSGLLLTAVPLAFVSILLLATWPNWHEETDDAGSEREVKPFPSRLTANVTIGMLTLGSLFCFISVLLQHVASATGSVMTEALSYSTVKGTIGTTSMVLGWGGSLLYTITLAGLVVMSVAMSRPIDDSSSNSGSSMSLVED
ncbi:hypothetical protein VTL71DRAFT_4064 [Oculimacula yallundae]|uniref:Membrane fusion mating protein FIG1 n=1 Tax=Oculimacula yallundae TaxID=86028 RepID=A0ABR4C6L8_9HELO